MKVRRAKRNPVKGVTTFYVTSEEDPKVEYMVVRFDNTPNKLTFCPCKDFFGRKLPHLGRNTFSHCKHGQKVRRLA
jgi:hypothetical protein